MLVQLDRLGRVLSDGLALFGAVGVIAMLVQVTADVVLRNMFSMAVPATVEIVSRYYMVAIAFLPLAWADRRGDMIVVEVFASAFRGVAKAILDRSVAVLTTMVYAFLAYSTFLVAMREASVGTIIMSLNLAVPIWPGYFFLPAGFAVATFVAALRIFLPSKPKHSQDLAL